MTGPVFPVKKLQRRNCYTRRHMGEIYSASKKSLENGVYIV